MSTELGKIADQWNAAGVPESVHEHVGGLLANGSLLLASEFGRRAGLNPQELLSSVQERRILCVEVGSITLYPAFYLDPSLARAELELLTQLLGDSNGGAKMIFFTTPRGSLARVHGERRTPIEALRDGDFESVKRCAMAFTGR